MSIHPKFHRFFNLYGGVLIGLVLLVAFFSVMSENFLTTTNLSNVLLQTSIVATVALGMTYVILLGDIDLSVGSIVALSGMVIVIGLSMGYPFPVVLALTFISAALCGLFNGVMVTKLGLNSFIVTVATMGIFRGIAFLSSGGRPVSMYDNEAFLFVANGEIAGVPVPIVILAILLACNHILLRKTTFGRKVYLVGGNSEAAEFSGINVNSVKLKVFVLSSVMCCVAGIMLASRMYSAQPNAAMGYELDAIAATVLGGTSLTGGRGTIIGTMIGALIIGCLNNGMNLLNVDYFFSLIVKGVVILVAVTIDVMKNKKAATA